MGRRQHYTTEDYANRILAYLSGFEDNTNTTERIIRDVTGTDYRLVDGIIYLMMENKIRPTFRKNKRTVWTITGAQ